MIMIDEKEIRKAATLTYNPALDAVANFSARNAFAAGVEWFKKALWHDVSEKPNTGSACLLEVEIEAAEELGNTIDYVESWYDAKSSWSVDYLSVLDDAPGVTYDIKKWCYIEDLLPKGGDK